MDLDERIGTVQVSGWGRCECCGKETSFCDMQIGVRVCSIGCLNSILDKISINDKCFKPEISRRAFYELKNICFDIQNQLMGMVQNEGSPITEQEMLDFENNKNNIINKINKISLDLKIEYDKL